jgi:hypothetical protein
MDANNLAIEVTGGAELPLAWLAPKNPPEGLADFVTGKQSAVPFSRARQEIVFALSRALLKDPVLKRDPAVVALAYWLRPSNVRVLADRFDALAAGARQCVVVPAGLIFHITPANVDTMFVYSWALSFLCGNRNAVRISSTRSELVEGILGVIGDVMETFPDLLEGNRFLTFPHDSQVLALLSRHCAVRVVWGGDETVARIRSVPLNPHASERMFASKYSYSVISTEEFLAANEQVKKTLAGLFYSDLFSFQQAACSSPHLVFWVGGEGRQAADFFAGLLQEEIERRKTRNSVAEAVRRLNYAFGLAADDLASFRPDRRGFQSLNLVSETLPRRFECRGGLYVNVPVATLEEVAAFAGEQDQTVTYFGFSEPELHEFARSAGGSGVDRIVPIGEALAFDTVWDGFDLMSDFTRRVQIKPWQR